MEQIGTKWHADFFYCCDCQMSILGYEVIWFDPVAGLSKKLFLKFFLDDNTIEIHNEKSAFLKRIHYPEISLNDLYVGNTITIYSRVMVINSYANVATAKYMSSREVHFITVVHLTESSKLGYYFDLCSSYKLTIGKVRTTSRDFSNFGLNVPKDCIVIETVALNGVDMEAFIGECTKLLHASLTMVLSTSKIMVNWEIIVMKIKCKVDCSYEDILELDADCIIVFWAHFNLMRNYELKNRPMTTDFLYRKSEIDNQ